MLAPRFGPNGTCEHASEQYGINIAFAIMETLLFLAAITCNGVVVIILYKKPRLRNQSNSHLMNLAIADLMFCLSFPLTVASCLLDDWPFGPITCQLQVFYILWVVLAIELNFPIFAIYRLLVMLRSQNRFAEFYKSHSLFLHLLTWFLAAFSALPPLFGWGQLTKCHTSYHCFLSLWNSKSYVIFLMVTTTVVPFLTMTVCYAKVIITVRQSSLRVQGAANNALSASCGSLAVCDDPNVLRVPTLAPQVLYTDRDFLPLPPRQQPRPLTNQRRTSIASTTVCKTRENAKRFSIASIASSTMSSVRPSEQRLGRSLGLITIAYLITWLPVVCFILNATFNANAHRELYVHLIRILLYLHVAVNPLAYGLLTDPFRSILSKIMKRRRTESSQEVQRWVPPSIVSSASQHKLKSSASQNLRPLVIEKDAADSAFPSPSQHQMNDGNDTTLRPCNISVLSATSDDEGRGLNALKDYQTTQSEDKVDKSKLPGDQT